MPRTNRATLLALATAGLLGLGGAGAIPAAQAATSETSSNWAGYAVSRSGVRYRHVRGTWVQPAVDCATSGAGSFSAAWVGLGGLSTSSQALEQIGTDADCSRGGTATYSAWYELVPSASVDLKELTIHAGDRLSASVDVRSHTVHLMLADLTTGKTVTRTLTAAQVDTSSAEWIVEAPSLCAGTQFCQTQPLANFSALQFGNARATTTNGHTGTIADPAWKSVAISLQPDARQHGFGPQRFVTATPSGSATPGSLSSTGTSFTVSYAQSAPPTTTAAPAMPGGFQSGPPPGT